MNAIKSLFTLFALILAFSVNAQLTGHPEIQKRLDDFIELTNQKKYDQAFDIMYPKMFATIQKEELVDMMNTMDKSAMSIHIDNRRITAFSVPFQDGNETFVRVSYSADMQVDIPKDGTYDSPKASIALLQEFETSYGVNNVKFNSEERKYTIHTNKAVMAIQESGKEWYLVEINTDQMELMKSLFSEPVMNALVLVD